MAGLSQSGLFACPAHPISIPAFILAYPTPICRQRKNLAGRGKGSLGAGRSQLGSLACTAYIFTCTARLISISGPELRQREEGYPLAWPGKGSRWLAKATPGY